MGFGQGKNHAFYARSEELMYPGDRHGRSVYYLRDIFLRGSKEFCISYDTRSKNVVNTILSFVGTTALLLTPIHAPMLLLQSSSYSETTVSCDSRAQSPGVFCVRMCVTSAPSPFVLEGCSMCHQYFGSRNPWRTKSKRITAECCFVCFTRRPFRSTRKRKYRGKDDDRMAGMLFEPDGS